MSRDTPENSAYETRATAFLDLLGFTALVKQSLQDPLVVPKLVRALEAIYESKPALATAPPPEIPSDYIEMLKRLIRSHTFSDSILVSSETSDPGISAIINGVCRVTTRLLGMGQLTRGAIVLGDLYHDDRIAFGPAFIEAYDLEQEAAIYPRILLSEAFIDRAKNHGFARYFRCDFDGMTYLDVLSWQIDSDPSDFGWLAFAQQWIADLRSDTEARLSSTSDARIRAKNIWFARYFNDTVSRYPELRVPPVITGHEAD